MHDVTFYIETQDVAGVQSHFVDVVGQLHAAGLATTSDLDLSLDDDGIADAFGDLDGLIDGVGDVAGRHGDAVTREVLLALVFEQIHLLQLSTKGLSDDNHVDSVQVLSRVQCRLEPRADLGQRRSGREDPSDAQGLEAGDVVVGYDPADHQQHVLAALGLEKVDDARDEDTMRAREEREPQGVGVFLNDRLDDLLGRLVQPRVDDLKTGVAQGSRDDLGAAVVPIKTGFGDDDSVRTIHGEPILLNNQYSAFRGPVGWF